MPLSSFLKTRGLRLVEKVELIGFFLDDPEIMGENA